jgi:NADH:ubiquinone oxidoreductase subunit 3 (subunit A)
MNEVWLLAPPVAFVVFLFMGWLLYKWGDSMAPKFNPTREKIVAYACGLDVPEGKPQPNYNLFHVAFIFTIFHVVTIMALTLATIPASSEGPSLLGMGYLMAVLVAIYAVITR